MEAQEREITSAVASDVPVPTSTAPSHSIQADGAADQDAEPHLLPGGFHAFKPAYGDDSTPVTNTQRPKTDAVITVRIIKSFEYRTMKALVLKSVDLTTLTVKELKEKCRSEIKSTPSFKALRSAAASLDTMKIYTKAHGSKTTNLIVNLDHPEWIMDEDDKTLESFGLENEAELSFFNRELYEAFLQNPETKWQ